MQGRRADERRRAKEQSSRRTGHARCDDVPPRGRDSGGSLAGARSRGLVHSARRHGDSALSRCSESLSWPEHCVATARRLNEEFRWWSSQRAGLAFGRYPLQRGNISSLVIGNDDRRLSARKHCAPRPGVSERQVDECTQTSSYCPALGGLSRTLRSSERFYLAGFAGFWLPTDILQCQQRRLDGLAILTESDSQKRCAALYDRGFRYVVIDRSTHSSMYYFEVEKTLAWLTVAMLKEEGPLVMLRMISNDPSRVSRVDCRQVADTAWDVLPQ
jgi:hypothetical protein